MIILASRLKLSTAILALTGTKIRAALVRDKAGAHRCGIHLHNFRGVMTSYADVKLDAYVLDTLMPDLVGHDRQPAAFLVYLFLWRKTLGDGVKSRPLSLQEIADGTGLSKRGVQDGLSRLMQRRLIGARRESITAVAEYSVQRPWSRGV